MLDMYINKVNEQKPNNLIDNGGESGIMKSGKVYGAYNSINDSMETKRNESANNYYEQIRNRDRVYEIKALSNNTGFSYEDTEKIFSHLFELEHLFLDGTVHRFHADYYMQNSYMRLRSGKNIQLHDIILMLHELEEAKIMGSSTDIVYETVHNEVQKKYNYQKALQEYLKENEA